MKISEIITDKYKLRIEPNVYYDLLADVREAEEEQEPCEDAVSRKEAISIASIATLSVNQVVTALEKLPPVNPQKPKSEWEHDHEILKAYSDGANEVLDKIKAEIEQEYNRLRATRADETLELGECLGLKMSLKIIDKYKSEGSDKK